MRVRRVNDGRHLQVFGLVLADRVARCGGTGVGAQGAERVKLLVGRLVLQGRGVVPVHVVLRGVLAQALVRKNPLMLAHHKILVIKMIMIR